MCEQCDELTVLVNDLNSGVRTMNSETAILMATLMVRQAQHPLAEALADLDGTDRRPGGDIALLERVAETLAGLSFAAFGNANAVHESATWLRRQRAQMS